MKLFIPSLAFFTLIILLTSPGFSHQQTGADVLDKDVFIKKWQISDPIDAGLDSSQQDMEHQKAWFNNQSYDIHQIINSIPAGKFELKDRSVNWRALESESDIIDLVETIGQEDYAFIYAYAEINSPEENQILFGLGSDDAVMMWVNGELVHSTFIGRAVYKDQDLVEAQLKQGKNTILLQVYNMEMGWGFVLRALGPSTFPDLLITSAAQGNLEGLKLLKKYDADLNATIGPGLAPIHVATIRGQRHVVEWLQDNNVQETEMPEKSALIDFMAERAVKADYPGAAILVAKDGDIVYQKGFGYANIDEKRAIEPDTKFRIGSVTKQFTAGAILILQEQGKLSVKDKLSKYFPDFPKGDQVTIHHLLTHTSGIHSFTNTPDFLEKVVGEFSQADLLAQIQSFSYDFDPGESYLYNNSGYYLLGVIIEKVSGKSYAEFLKENFFEPLNMSDTGVHYPAIQLDKEALGYQFEDGKIKPALNWNMDFAGGAGNLYSTVLDLYKWNEALFSGNVLSEASMKAAFTPALLNNGEKAGSGYGYGWGIGKNRGLQVLQHTGGLHGFSTSLARFPAHQLTVAIVTNALPNIPDLNPAGLTVQIGELYLHEFMEEQQVFVEATDLDPAVLDDYIGKYDYQSAIMTIRRDGDQLFAQLVGQPEFEIFPASKDKFFWRVVDAQIEFKRDDNGFVTHAIHTQNGGELKVNKIEEKEVVLLSPEILQSFVGEYELSPGTILKITRDGDQLSAQVTGQPRLQIFPSSENEFFFKEVNATLTFNTGNEGKVKSVFLHQGPVKKEAVKIK